MFRTRRKYSRTFVIQKFRFQQSKAMEPFDISFELSFTKLQVLKFYTFTLSIY